MTWGDAQGSGKNLLGVEMWCRAEKSFWGCVFIFSTWNVTVELAVNMGMCWFLLVVGDPYRGVLGRGVGLWGACGWGSTCQLWLVPLPLYVSGGLHPSGKSSWLYILRAGMTAFILPPKYNEAVRAAVLKAVQRGFGCSVLIKICWENRCQNPGFDIINLPAPNESKRESWERQMSLQLTETSWDHVRFKEFIFLYMSFHLCLLKNEEWLWG